MTPHRTPFFLPWIYPSLTWRVLTTDKDLYLTFDDGPIPGPTEFVLETLKRANAKATFFSIGDNIRKHPDIFLKIIEDGHAYGNHTFNHLNGWKTNATQYLANISKFNEAVLQLSHRPVSKLFRPPYGRITYKQIATLTDYKIIMWDVLSVDYNRSLHHEKCLKNTIKSVRPGSIIVFHDSLKAEKNMSYALPRLLDHFTTAGYTFKALDV